MEEMMEILIRGIPWLLIAFWWFQIETRPYGPNFIGRISLWTAVVFWWIQFCAWLLL